MHAASLDQGSPTVHTSVLLEWYVLLSLSEVVAMVKLSERMRQCVLFVISLKYKDVYIYKKKLIRK